MKDVSVDIFLVIISFLKLPDLAALSRACTSYFFIIEKEMQREALANGLGLIQACEEKNFLLSRHLLSSNIDDYLDKHPKASLHLPESLHLAVFQPPNGQGCLPGCEDVLQELIERGVDLDAQDKNGRTALHQAIDHCASFRHMETLLRAGANPNLQDRWGNTALHLAVRMLNQKMVNLLLERGADVDSLNNSGDTPLHGLTSSGSRPSILDPDIMNLFMECIKHLLRAGADPNIRNSRHETPLTKVVRIHQVEAVEAVKELLNYEADPSASSAYGTAAHLAARLGHISILEKLIEFNSDINARDIRDYTPLHYAVEHDHLPIVELLLQHDANLEARDNRYHTPLHFASELYRPSILQLLLNQEVNVNPRNDEDSTPLHLASWPHESSLECVKLLLAKGADPNAYDAYGETALHHAVLQRPEDPTYHVSAEIVKALIFSGADPNTPAVGIPGYDGGIPQLCTALHVAAGSGNLAAVELLINSGGDPNAKDFNGETPFDKARKARPYSRERSECANLLLGKVLTP